MHCVGRLSSVVLLGAVLAGTGVLGAGQSADPGAGAAFTEEFVGPFPSWTNVKTAYGAIGDGTNDDTDALQRALKSLGTPGHSPVLYIPAGRYRLTRTLTLDHTIYVSIVGEDPQTVTLVWDGPPGGTMLIVNGVAYSRFTRLTYDGRRRASVAVEQSWDNVSPNFDTGNEYSDHAFVDVEYGIHGGFRGYGFAETSILRSRFVRNSKAGVALGNFNALDAWIWHSTFEDCAIGVTNEPGAGNFRVYDSTFRRSTVADLFMQNTGAFSVRGNFSINSKAFYVSGTPINHPATIEIQGNTILDPVDPVAIRLNNQGPGLLLDNVVRSRPGVPGPIVRWRTAIDADVATIGNTFTAVNAVTSNGRLIAIDDRVVRQSSITAAEPRRQTALPNPGRPIVEVAGGASAAAIQQAINSAARMNGRRPVVHLPSGTYAIDRTLTIPASDVQLVGDGPSILRWKGSGSGPVIRISGPSRVTLRELQIDGAKSADGVVVDGLDQDGARVYLEGVQTRAGVETNLFVDHLNRANVELTDFGHAYSAKGVSVKVLGGAATIFSGASSGNMLSYEVADGGALRLRDLWYEGDAPGGFASIHDRATFTIQGSRVAMPADRPSAAFHIANLDGRVAILTTHIDDRIAVSGNGSRAEILGLGIFREYHESAYVADTSRPAAHVLMANARQRTKTQGQFSRGSVPVADIGAMDAGLVRRAIAGARDHLLPGASAPPPGASDIKMFRVWVSDGLNNIRLTGNGPGAPPR